MSGSATPASIRSGSGSSDSSEEEEDPYYRWREETFGDEFEIWHEGFDSDPVLSLRDEARDHAVHMLTQGILLHKDGYAATALADMRETAALPQLCDALPQATESDRIQFAQAINALSDEVNVKSSMMSEIIALLDQEALSWSVRLDAARALSIFKDPESEEALLRAVQQDDYLVRYHASQSLLTLWDIETKDIASHTLIFKYICDAKEGDIEQDSAGRKRETVRLLRELKQRGTRL